MKVCSKCKVEKPYTSFPKSKQDSSGYQSWCTACKVAQNKEYMKKNPEKIALWKKKYYETNKGKATMIRNKKTYQQKNREKYLAHKAVWSAKQRKNNPLVAPENCENCGIKKNLLHAHHYAGYDKENWYKVIFLCRSCHNKQHS